MLLGAQKWPLLVSFWRDHSASFCRHRFSASRQKQQTEGPVLAGTWPHRSNRDTESQEGGGRRALGTTKQGPRPPRRETDGTKAQVLQARSRREAREWL